MSFLYGTALLLDICSETLTLRKLTLLKFSLLAKPARAASENPEFLFTAENTKKPKEEKVEQQRHRKTSNHHIETQTGVQITIKLRGMSVSKFRLLKMFFLGWND